MKPNNPQNINEQTNQATNLSSANAKNDMILLSSGFGIICAVILVVIIIIFVLDSLSDEPEMYWREK